MIVDTSAWVEFLRGTGSPTHHRLRTAIETGEPLATPTPVLMELLAGARDEGAAADLQRMLAGFDSVEVEGPLDFEDAALLYRACRRQGETVRSLIDCLVAAMALRVGRAVLHANRDYDAIARCVPLDVVRADAPT